MEIPTQPTPDCDPMIRHILENKIFYYSIGCIIIGALVAGAALLASLPQASIFLISAATTAISYPLFLYSLMTELRIKDSKFGKNVILAIALYFVYTILLTAQFTCAWEFAGGFGQSDSRIIYYPGTAPLIDAIYFSTTAFTTVGFGDYIPKIPSGKLYFCFEAIISLTHNVAFFSILLTRLTTTTRNSTVESHTSETA